jgi:hypothetical protein
MELTMEFEFMAAPGGLFEAVPDHFEFENESITNQWTDMELDPTSPSMSLFHELEQVQEVQETIKPTPTSALLADLINECGIEVVEEATAPSSPTSSLDSGMEDHQSLIDELEQFFGSPTHVDAPETSYPGLDLVSKAEVVARASPSSILRALSTGQVLLPAQAEAMVSEADLRNALTTSCVTEDGHSVVIIVAPASPALDTTTDTDSDWVPSSPASPLRSLGPASGAIRKRYQRSKPASPPAGPYPVEKKARKKAQNRTAAFRYREKKKGELDCVDTELELLAAKNVALSAQLKEMETEARLLKKLMAEVGLGSYANAIKL